MYTHPNTWIIPSVVRQLIQNINVNLSCLICPFYCSLSAGTYNNQEAILYSMSVADTYISGGMFDKEKERNTADGSKYDCRCSWLNFANNTVYRYQ